MAFGRFPGCFGFWKWYRQAVIETFCHDTRRRSGFIEIQ